MSRQQIEQGIETLVRLGLVEDVIKGSLRMLSRSVRDQSDMSCTSLSLTPPDGPERRPLTPAGASLVRRCARLKKLELSSRMRGRETQAILSAAGSCLSELIIDVAFPQLVETDTGSLLSGLKALESLTVNCIAYDRSDDETFTNWISYRSAVQAMAGNYRTWFAEVIPGIVESACVIPLRELTLKLDDGAGSGYDKVTRSLAVLLSSVAPTLRRFSYTGPRPGSVARVVAESPAALAFLTLAINKVEDDLPEEQYEAVADAIFELGGRRSLTKLELLGTFHDVGLLARGIKSHKCLVSLCVGMHMVERSIHIDDVTRDCHWIVLSDVAKLGAALCSLPRLRELSLIDLGLIHPPPPEIVSAIAVPTLTSLTLNNLSEMHTGTIPINLAPLTALTGLKELCITDTDGNSPNLLAGLTAMTQLTKLDLSGNILSSDAFCALARSLRTSCSSLHELLMAGVEIDFDTADMLAAALRNTPARLRIFDITRSGDVATTAILAHTAKTFHPGCKVIAEADILSLMGYA